METRAVKPKVSILIPVYNREKLIAGTLDSALAQTYPEIEVVVVDNCSTDGTWGVLERYAKQDSRVKAYRNAANIGPVRNWKACIEKASGEYGKILWSDDLIAPDFLEKTLPYFDDAEVGFVFTMVQIFSENSRQYVYGIGDTGVYSSADFIRGSLLGTEYPVSPGAAIFRMKDLRTNLLADIPNKFGMDFPDTAIGNDLLVYLLTAAQYPKFAFISEPLSLFRLHGDSISIASKSAKLELFYKTAAAFFAEKFVAEAGLLRKFNATLLFSRLFKIVELRRIDAFYPSSAPRPVDWVFFTGLVGKRAIRCFFRIFKK